MRHYHRVIPRKLNLTEKRAKTAEDISRFVKQYARKAQKRQEPNDRDYDRKIEQAVKRMRPEDLDELLRHGETDADPNDLGTLEPRP